MAIDYSKTTKEELIVEITRLLSVEKEKKSLELQVQNLEQELNIEIKNRDTAVLKTQQQEGIISVYKSNEETTRQRIADLEQELATAFKVRDEAIQNEYLRKNEITRQNETISHLQIENNTLKKYAEELAVIFDEVFVALRDQTSIFGVMLRNAKNVEAFLQNKINAFNGPIEKETKK